jgi:hypothetical protein
MLDAIVILLVGAAFGSLITRAVIKDQIRKQNTAKYRRWSDAKRAKQKAAAENGG